MPNGKIEYDPHQPSANYMEIVAGGGDVFGTAWFILGPPFVFLENLLRSEIKIPKPSEKPSARAPSSYAELLELLKYLGPKEKTLRKETEEEFLSDEVEYENIKKVIGKGPYHVKRIEKEFACD